MKTIFEKSDEVIALMKSKATYLGIDAERINEGVNLEDENEIFEFSGSFIRVYSAPLGASDYSQAQMLNGKKASMMVVCGVECPADSLQGSKDTFELAERIERLLMESELINRSIEPIFPLKNEDGVSVFAVLFWYPYKSSAGDPND